MQSGERFTINDREYRLETVLSTGAGNYGQVWAATDDAGRAVALKFINAEAMAEADPSLRGHWRAHLEREIVFLNGLDADQSRHIVALIDAGLVDDQPVLVLERLQANLGQWLAQHRRDRASPPDLAQILDWAEQMLDGLEVVHRAGFVYRDLKFSNLLVGDDGALLKLADFGALKRETGDSTRSFIGTPATMAPEQALPVRRAADGGCEYAVDYRADYYALGLLLFTLLTEQPATAAQRRLGQTLALYGQEGASQHCEQWGGLSDEEQALLRRAIEFWTVPVSTLPGGGGATALTELIIRLLARDPADRVQNSAAIRIALAAVRVEQPLLPTIAPDLAPDWIPPLPARPSRRPGAATHHSPRLRRGAGLASLLALAGAMAWAIVQPSGTFNLQSTAPPIAVVAAIKPVLPDASTASPPPPGASPAVVVQTPPPEPPAVPEPHQEEPSTVSVATRPEPEPAPAPVPAQVAEPAIADAPAPGDSEPTMPAGIAAPSAAESAVVRQTPKPARERSAQKTVKTPSPASEPIEKAAKAVKPSPPAVELMEKAAKAGKPPAPLAAKPAVKSPASTAPEVVRKPPPVAKAAPASRPGKTPVPVARISPTPASSAVANLTPSARPDPLPDRLDRSATRTEQSSRAGSQPSSLPPDLPPIELESRPQPPPIRLVSRPEPAPARPLPPVATPRPPTPNRNSPPPTRTADPVAQFREDANRAAADLRREAESVGNWASNTGKEIQRGLASANRAVNQLTGNCDPAEDCVRSPRVERRDRWSSRKVGTVSQHPSPPPDDEETGFVEPPPSQYHYR
jgi:serine/threonine protein kinase